MVKAFSDMPSLTDFDTSSFMLSLLVSGVGFVLFVYGKKQQRMPQLMAGVVFMVYPYFVTNAWAMLTVGGVLGAVLWYAVRIGGW